jgi:uncharacterized protein YjbI with pentapeptide repeats
MTSALARSLRSIEAVDPDGRNELASLRARRTERGPLPRVDILLAGRRLVGEDLSRLDFSGCDLTGADLSNADLRGARFVGACLKGAVLYGARMDGCELMTADLSDAELSDATLEQAGFGKANLSGATMFGARAKNASFTHANLSGADLRTADVSHCRMMSAELVGTRFDNADLRESDLSESAVHGASFAGTDLRASRLRHIEGYKKAGWVGADVRDVDWSGGWLLRRHILDENFLDEFRRQGPAHRAIHWIWWASSDCGRSVARWGGWTVVVALLYGFAFRFVELDYGSYETALSPLYYSIVTFTTLGYGDVLPVSNAAKLMALSEVCVGYFSLGGLLSILSNKLARRAD